jgi:hypothetical protein
MKRFRKWLRVFGFFLIFFQIVVYIGHQPKDFYFVNEFDYGFKNISKFDYYITNTFGTMFAGIINLDLDQFSYGLGSSIGKHFFIIIGLIIEFIFVRWFFKK